MPTWLKLAVESEQRVSLGQGGERAFLTSTHPVIPGSVMRGALAAAWVTQGGSRNDEFKAVFEKARFSAVMPRGVQVIGQSVRACKYHRSCAANHREFHDEALFGRLPMEFRGCGGMPYSIGGYSQVAAVTLTTTALTPRKHVAAEGKLFSRQAIERGTRFDGWVVLPDGVPTDQLVGLGSVFVGGRSSVMGRCTIHFEDGSAPVLAAAGQPTVVLRTRSHSLLLDDAGAASGDLAGALRQMGVEVIDTWARRMDSAAAGGWHLASGLPKPTEIGLAPGATALVKNPGATALSAVLAKGLGVRRTEGYGWLDVVGHDPEPADRGEPSHSEMGTPVEADSHSWLVTVNLLRLTAMQRQWLAGRLRLRSVGHVLATAEWNEPGLARLSDPQRSALEEIVRDVPQDQRSSLAYAITKGISA